MAIRVRSRLWSSAVFGRMKTYRRFPVLVTMKRLWSPGGGKFVTAAEQSLGLTASGQLTLLVDRTVIVAGRRS
jgi:hypothetical protein